MILFIQNELPHYRREFYTALTEYDEVAVAHSGPRLTDNRQSFREINLDAHRVGPFIFQNGLRAAIKSIRPTSVVAMFDIRWPNTIREMFRWEKRLRWIWWGLDEGNSTAALYLKLLIARRGNPVVFYNKTIRDRFADLGLLSQNLFVANNTFHVPNRVRSYENTKKNKFINVGSLHQRKENDVTISAFQNMLRKTGLDLQLILIGDGFERESLERQVKKAKLENHVIMPGRINDSAVLADYYREAIASVSFGQAGLAVLQSMAFGVPFVTKRGAISGGEIHNIIHGENGLLCEDSQDALEACLVRLATRPAYARQLGEKAYEYYTKECSVKTMALGFIQAIQAGQISSD